MEERESEIKRAYVAKGREEYSGATEAHGGVEANAAGREE